MQSVTDQVNTLSQGGQKLSSSNALLSLILAPYVLDEAKRVHKTISESQAQQVIGKIADPSPATITFVRMQLAVQELDQASKNLIVGELDKAKITRQPPLRHLRPQADNDDSDLPELDQGQRTFAGQVRMTTIDCAFH